MYLLSTVLFGFLLLFWGLDGHVIVKERICKNWHDFRQVNKLVEMKYKTIGMIIWISMKLIAKMYWLNFLQWVNTTLVQKDKRTLELSYVYKGRLYKILLKPKRGPSSVLLVTDEDKQDITDDILPYMGVSQDWHKTEFTPDFWNKQTLTFELSSGEHVTFQKDDAIVV